jgi:hypothetical protein
MTKTTTIEEFNDEGNLVKRTVIEEDGPPLMKLTPFPNTSPGYPGQIQVWNADHSRLYG